MNDLSNSVHQGSIKLKKSLDKLIEYTNYHFDSEEKHFIKCKYPFSDSHIKEHKELRNRILHLKAKFGIDRQIDINELTKFTKELQIKHMMLSGKKFVLYLTRKTNFVVS